MQDGVDGLLHDAACLHGLVDFVQQYCAEQLVSQSYLDATVEFFGYVENLARGTKQFLSDSTALASKSQQRIDAVRADLLLVKAYWRLLHAFIKPASDAHTLRIPCSLIRLAVRQVGRVAGMQDAKVAILLTPELMYFQTPHTHLKDLAAPLNKVIPLAAFPAKLGFVELPYSQGPSFFNNLILYHELGHFTFEELSSSSPFDSEFAALDSAIIASLQANIADFGSRSPQVQWLALQLLRTWTQEIFADLFALRLIGPAFSFAFIELLGLLGLLRDGREMNFSESHPAQACRFSEQVKQLDDDGWWNAIKGIRAEHLELIAEVASRPPKHYRLDPELFEQDPGLIRAFRGILPKIRRLVRSITKGAAASVGEYHKYKAHVRKCLMHGIVPSTPLRLRVPTPVAIINAAFCFYLISLPDLMSRLEDQKPSDIERRSYWTQRLEMWALKAVEDCEVVAQCQGGLA